MCSTCKQGSLVFPVSHLARHLPQFNWKSRVSLQARVRLYLHVLICDSGKGWKKKVLSHVLCVWGVGWKLAVGRWFRHRPDWLPGSLRQNHNPATTTPLAPHSPHVPPLIPPLPLAQADARFNTASTKQTQTTAVPPLRGVVQDVW